MLDRALASILGQTYRNWHLCLVNDGGDVQDVNRIVAEHLSAFEERLTVRHHAASMGMEAASNAAMAGIQGDFVVVHDDDDTWSPAFLEETVAFLNKPENACYAAVATNLAAVFERVEGDKIIEDKRYPYGLWQERIDFGNMLAANNVPPISVLIRKSVVDYLGGFNASLPVLGDWDFNLRVLMVGDIGMINQELAYYHHRLTAGQDSAYGNSIINGRDRHLEYQVLYRNSLIRQLLAKEPENLGLLHALIYRIEQAEQRINRQQLEILNALNLVLFPVRCAESLFSRLRRLISRNPALKAFLRRLLGK